jgi:integrase
LIGSGVVYQQKYASGKIGRVWWISYRARGVKKDGSYGSVLHRESSHTTKRAVAVKLLRHRVGEAASGKPIIGAAAEKLTLGEMLGAIISRYQSDSKSACVLMARRAKHHLLEFFGEHARVITITPTRLDEYKRARQQSFINKLQENPEGKQVKVRAHPQTSSINRELAILRVAFHLMLETNRILRDHVPMIRFLKQNGPRQGFVEPEDFEHLHAALPRDLQDAVRFLYVTSWRKGAMQSLEWRDCELEFNAEREIIGGRVNLRAENSKTRHAQTLPLNGEVLEVIKSAWARRDLKCTFVFHRDGRQIGAFRKAWLAACKAIGRPNLVVHDLRRSGIRNLVRAGVPEVVAMGISGHRTRATFTRYNIVSDADLTAAMAAVTIYNQARAVQQQPKVVPIRKTA